MAETQGKRKNVKSLTETFTTKTLRKGFDRLGGVASKLRGANRGTRGISAARRAKKK